MSLESKIEALTAAIAELNDHFAQGKAPPVARAAEKVEEGPDEGSEAPLVWYHKHETKEVWQEPEQGRRKGITKVDESTAKRLLEEYEQEAEEAKGEDGEKEDDDDLGLDLGGSEEKAPEPMDDDEFAKAWKDWTTRAVQHMTSAGEDKESAQKAVKKFIVPKVREYVTEGDVKASNVPTDRRREFLAEAEKFFD